jgi:hypothetical protein
MDEGGVMLLIKRGVDLSKLTGRMAVAALVVEGIYEDLRANAVVTSGCEGEHSEGSKHYTGDALDFRTLHLTGHFREQLASRCREALNEQFDVVLEKDHLHVEWDPK